MLVAVQLSVPGLYLPPVFDSREARSNSAPDDHFTAGPDCRVKVSRRGRVGGAGGCPTICSWDCTPAGVRSRCRTPIRPRRSFRCRSTPPCERSTSGRIGRAGGCPSIRSASSRRIRYCGKHVVSVRHVAVFRFAPSLASLPVTPYAIRQLAKSRSTSAGLARHSAMTKGSFPSASNSSRRTSGCFVSRAIRSISACSCSAVMGFCQ